MNTFGNNFRVSVFGASHGPVVGVLLDGVPAGIDLSEADFEYDLKRRSPSSIYETARREEDKPLILSGVYDGYTTGAPICIEFRNSDPHSSDYKTFAHTPRPGTADYPAMAKYEGYADLRGSGPFSGRMTLAVVAAGVVAKKLLPRELTFKSEVVELGGSSDSSSWKALLDEARKEGDSLGAVVQCSVSGLPIGIGEPFWDSCESVIAHVIFAIPGVRGLEFGDGFRASAMKGSEHNDPIGLHGPLKNGSGGINGGLTNGAELCFRVAFKPTSSISKTQISLNMETSQMEELSVRGRHDVCFALRCPVIVEAACAIALAELFAAS
ncbi:MAG: chorismate synthase [Candidatus Cryptobacteroides sp.]